MLPLVESMIVLPGREQPGADRVADHLVGGAVLDRAARVEELALGPDLDAGRVALERVQPHDRRVADEIGDPLGHAHPGAPDDVGVADHRRSSDLLRERLAAVERQAQVADPRRERTSRRAHEHLQRLRRGQRPGEHRGRRRSSEGAAATNGALAVASGVGARRGERHQVDDVGLRPHGDDRAARAAAATPPSASSSKPERTTRSTLARRSRQALRRTASRYPVPRSGEWARRPGQRPPARRYGAAVSAARSLPTTATRAAEMRACPSGPISGSAIWRA